MEFAIVVAGLGMAVVKSDDGVKVGVLEGDGDNGVGLV